MMRASMDSRLSTHSPLFSSTVGLAALALIASCGSKPSASLGEPSKESSLVNTNKDDKGASNSSAGNTACEPLVNALARADFGSWTGWPTGCDLTKLEETFTFAPTTTTSVAGDNRQSIFVRRAELPGVAQPLVLWLRETTVVRASLRYPEVDDPAEVIKRLGQPSTKLDAIFGSVPIPKPKAEWVYAERGVTLFMSADASKILAVAVYPASTVEQYKNELHFSQAQRERD